MSCFARIFMTVLLYLDFNQSSAFWPPQLSLLSYDVLFVATSAALLKNLSFYIDK